MEANFSPSFFVSVDMKQTIWHILQPFHTWLRILFAFIWNEIRNMTHKVCFQLTASMWIWLATNCIEFSSSLLSLSEFPAPKKNCLECEDRGFFFPPSRSWSSKCGFLLFEEHLETIILVYSSHLASGGEKSTFSFLSFSETCLTGLKEDSDSTWECFPVYELCHHPFHTWFGYKLFLISLLFFTCYFYWTTKHPALLCVPIGNVIFPLTLSLSLWAFNYSQRVLKRKIFEFFIKIYVNSNLHKTHASLSEIFVSSNVFILLCALSALFLFPLQASRAFEELYLSLYSLWRRIIPLKCLRWKINWFKMFNIRFLHFPLQISRHVHIRRWKLVSLLFSCQQTHQSGFWTKQQCRFKGEKLYACRTHVTRRICIQFHWTFLSCVASTTTDCSHFVG